MKFQANYLWGAALAVLFTPAADLQAGWRHLHGGSSGSYASHGSSGVSYSSSGHGSSGYSSYSVSYGSSGYSASSGSWGSSGASSGYPVLFPRIRHHFAMKRARRAAYYASSGGSSGYGSSGYTTSYSSSGGSSGVSYHSNYGSSGAAVSYAPATVSYGSSGNVGVSSPNSYYGSRPAPLAVQSLASNAAGDTVYLSVAVPSETKLFVNGKQTTSKGTLRQFVSRGLTAGKSYTFKIRAELGSADGENLVETKDVVVHAGSSESVAFDFDSSNKSIETALTLNVPDGAKVTLAGNNTKAIGDVRTYRTTNMKVGEVWDDYEVQVAFDGQVKKQAIRLIAGDNLELTFDFDQPDKLAAR